MSAQQSPDQNESKLARAVHRAQVDKDKAHLIDWHESMPHAYDMHMTECTCSEANWLINEFHVCINDSQFIAGRKG